MLWNVLRFMLKLCIFLIFSSVFYFPLYHFIFNTSIGILNRLLVKQPANILKTYRPLLFSTFSPERTLHLELRSLGRNKP